MLQKPRPWLYLTLGVVLLGLTGFFSTRRGDTTASRGSVPVRNYQRIVSLAPSITETLFALGLGDRVVGVTRYCDYPPAAVEKAKIGGYYDLNYEAIVALQPDLVVCLNEHAENHNNLQNLDLNYHTLDHDRVETILASIRSLGETCGVKARSDELVSGIEERMARIKARRIDQRRPRVMVCIGRHMGFADLGNVYIAGRDGFYSQMIELAGGVNVYQDELAFPVVTGEGLMHLAPEIVIDMVPDLAQRGLTVDQVRAQWQQLPDLPAVRNGRVFVFTDDFVVIPGPRFVQILEKMAAVLHPEGVLP